MTYFQKQRVSFLWLPLAIFFAFLTLTLLLAFAVQKQEKLKIKMLLETEANDISTTLNLKLSSVHNSLNHMVKRWNSANGTPLPQWEADAQTYINDYPVLEGISLADVNKTLIDIEPKQEYQTAIGYKLDTDPQRAEVIQRVLSTGKSQMSHVLDLRTGKKGFLYINELTDHGNFNGLMIAVLEPNTLFNSILSEDRSKTDKYNYLITVEENNNTVFLSIPQDSPITNKWSTEYIDSNYGLEWKITVQPTDQFLKTHRSYLSLGVLAIGTTMAALIALCTYFALVWRSQTKRLVETEAVNVAIMANAGSAIIAADLEGKVLVFNQAAEGMLGYSALEVIGKHTPAIWHDPSEVIQRAEQLSKSLGREIKPGFQTFIANVMENGPETIEWTYINKNGYRLPVLLTLSLLQDNAGKTIGFMGIAQDITEQKLQQEALKTSEETFRAAMENASIGMAIISPKGEWLKVNKALCDMLGYHREELLAIDFQTITYGEDREESLAKVQNLLSRRVATYEFEKRYIHKKGHVVWALLNSSAVWNADGTPNYMITQILNISERKQIEQMKDEFVSIVSHELRTPLTSIRGSLGLIAGTMSKDLPQQVVRLVDIAHKNSERLILLINDILDMDKIAAGKMRFDPKNELVLPLMLQAAEANRAYAEKYGVRIELDHIPSDLAINVDINRLMQVLSNLISNAAKFSETGSLIRLSVDTNGKTVRISVHDSGRGISENFKPRIFGKFLQADSSVRREKGGTGLGLHISKQIVTHMGGTIDFESTAGKGTTFWVEFPNAEFLPEVVMSNDLVQRINGNRNILICEDDEDTATILKTQLEMAGFHADIALNLALARGFLKVGRYLAVTLDIMFPEENGIDFISELRSRPATANLPIVVVSATAEDGRQRLKGDAIGVVDWLTKPFDQKDLIAALQHVTNVEQTAKARVLHIEDDRDLSNVLSTVLDGRAELVNVVTLQEAKGKLQDESFTLIVLDIGLPDGNGLALLNSAELTQNPTPVLILSADETPEYIRERVAASMVKSRMSETKIVETILSLIKSLQEADHHE